MPPLRLNEDSRRYGLLEEPLDLILGGRGFRDVGFGDRFHSLFNYLQKTNPKGSSLKDTIGADFFSNRRNLTVFATSAYPRKNRPMKIQADISEYLRDTRSQLTIDFFSLDEEADTETYVLVDPKYVKVEDFSRSVEGIPTPLANSYDETVNLSSIHRDFCSGCTYEGDCSDASKCQCQKLHQPLAEAVAADCAGCRHETLQPSYRKKRVPGALLNMNEDYWDEVWDEEAIRRVEQGDEGAPPPANFDAGEGEEEDTPGDVFL
ncbi:unnamed protein product [Caenorhabditis sp. 36 PRJEB53466]|nr:unnamed protein product [Caenorhabditis sp. 36 PRJEB53466]